MRTYPGNHITGHHAAATSGRLMPGAAPDEAILETRMFWPSAGPESPWQVPSETFPPQAETAPVGPSAQQRKQTNR